MLDTQVGRNRGARPSLRSPRGVPLCQRAFAPENEFQRISFSLNFYPSTLSSRITRKFCQISSLNFSTRQNSSGFGEFLRFADLSRLGGVRASRRNRRSNPDRRPERPWGVDGPLFSSHSRLAAIHCTSNRQSCRSESRLSWSESATCIFLVDRPLCLSDHHV